MGDIIVNGVFLSRRNKQVEGCTNKKNRQESIKDIVDFCSFRQGNRVCFEFKEEQTFEEFNKLIDRFIVGKGLRKKNLKEFKDHIKERGKIHVFTTNKVIQGDLVEYNHARSNGYRVITIENCKRGN